MSSWMWLLVIVVEDVHDMLSLLSYLISVIHVISVISGHAPLGHALATVRFTPSENTHAATVSQAQLHSIVS